MLSTQSDSVEISDLKKSIYNLMYMDNGCVGFDGSDSLMWAYSNVCSIFEPFKFSLQQFLSNDVLVQSVLIRS